MVVLGISGIRRVFDGSQLISINCVSPSSRMVFATIGTIVRLVTEMMYFLKS